MASVASARLYYGMIFAMDTRVSALDADTVARSAAAMVKPVGPAFRATRESAGFNIFDVSVELDRNLTSTLSRMERDQRTLTLPFALRLCSVYRAPLSAILRMNEGDPAPRMLRTRLSVDMVEPIMVEVGRQLGCARRICGLGLKTVAPLVGRSASNISQIEGHHQWKKLTVMDVAAFCVVYGNQVHELMSDVEKRFGIR